MKLSVAIGHQLALLQQLTAVSTLILQASADGRDELNDIEENAIIASNDQARNEFVSKIAAAKAAGH